MKTLHQELVRKLLCWRDPGFLAHLGEEGREIEALWNDESAESCASIGWMLLRQEGFRRLCLARELLQDCEGPSVASAARAVGISPFHFIRQFVAVFGVTPHQFRITARLERAKELLSTGRSVTEVCLEVGFSSLGSFSALFRRRIGESPSAYRGRLRQAYPDPHVRSAVLAPGCLSLMSRVPHSPASDGSAIPEKHLSRQRSRVPSGSGGKRTP